MWLFFLSCVVMVHIETVVPKCIEDKIMKPKLPSVISEPKAIRKYFSSHSSTAVNDYYSDSNSESTKPNLINFHEAVKEEITTLSKKAIKSKEALEVEGGSVQAAEETISKKLFQRFWRWLGSLRFLLPNFSYLLDFYNDSVNAKNPFPQKIVPNMENHSSDIHKDQMDSSKNFFKRSAKTGNRKLSKVSSGTERYIMRIPYTYPPLRIQLKPKKSVYSVHGSILIPHKFYVEGTLKKVQGSTERNIIHRRGVYINKEGRPVARFRGRITRASNRKKRKADIEKIYIIGGDGFNLSSRTVPDEDSGTKYLWSNSIFETSNRPMEMLFRVPNITEILMDYDNLININELRNYEPLDPDRSILINQNFRPTKNDGENATEKQNQDKRTEFNWYQGEHVYDDLIPEFEYTEKLKKHKSEPSFKSTTILEKPYIITNNNSIIFHKKESHVPTLTVKNQSNDMDINDNEFRFTTSEYKIINNASSFWSKTLLEENDYQTNLKIKERNYNANEKEEEKIKSSFDMFSDFPGDFQISETESQGFEKSNTEISMIKNDKNLDQKLWSPLRFKDITTDSSDDNEEDDIWLKWGKILGQESTNFIKQTPPKHIMSAPSFLTTRVWPETRKISPETSIPKFTHEEIIVRPLEKLSTTQHSPLTKNPKEVIWPKWVKYSTLQPKESSKIHRWPEWEKKNTTTKQPMESNRKNIKLSKANMVPDFLPLSDIVNMQQTTETKKIWVMWHNVYKNKNPIRHTEPTQSTTQEENELEIRFGNKEDKDDDEELDDAQWPAVGAADPAEIKKKIKLTASPSSTLNVSTTDSGITNSSDVGKNESTSDPIESIHINTSENSTDENTTLTKELDIFGKNNESERTESIHIITTKSAEDSANKSGENMQGTTTYNPNDQDGPVKDGDGKTKLPGDESGVGNNSNGSKNGGDNNGSKNGGDNNGSENGGGNKQSKNRGDNDPSKNEGGIMPPEDFYEYNDKGKDNYEDDREYPSRDEKFKPKRRRSRKKCTKLRNTSFKFVASNYLLLLNFALFLFHHE